MKDKIKLIFIEMAYMLAVLVVSTIANPVQFLGKKVNEPITGGVMGYGVDYIYNPIAYIAGIVIFAGFALVAYSRWYKSFADRTLKSGWIFVIVYVFIDLVMSFIMFIVLIFEALFLLGFDDNILPELLQFITMFCWPVALSLFMIAIMFPSLRKKD